MEHSTEGHQIEIRLPSRLELLGVIDKVVEALTEQMEFEDYDRDAIAISVVEACTNAIQHGHRARPELTVDVVFEMRKDALAVTVRDEGSGFSLELDEDPSPPPDLLQTRGRGIFIMRSMMDDLEFDFSEGTRVTLIKYRSSAGKEEEVAG